MAQQESKKRNKQPANSANKPQRDSFDDFDNYDDFEDFAADDYENDDPYADAKVEKVKKEKKSGRKKDYPKLPERELRRQLRVIERRARIRLSMILSGLFSIALVFLGRYTLGIISIIGVLIAAFGVLYSLFAFIRIKTVKWYFIIIGLALNIGGIALGISDVLYVVNNLGDIIAHFEALLGSFI